MEVEKTKPLEGQPCQVTRPQEVSKQQIHLTTSSPLPQGTNAASVGNSVEAQRQRLLEHIRCHGSINTIEARRDLDIMHPGGRVLELRKKGEPIQTIWTSAVTEAGKTHRVGRYVLTRQSEEVANV